MLQIYFRMYSSGKYFPDKRCCQYGWFHHLDELKFWDVLDALLDGGVEVNHVNNKGKTPLRAFEKIKPHGYELDMDSVCSENCRKYVSEEESRMFFYLRYGAIEENLAPNTYLTRMRNYQHRLSQ